MVRQEFFHHREDHNHLLKRIVNCLRECHIPGVDLRYLRDALHDKTTGLTYEALTGKNKQSVCERIISPGVINFLDIKGHKTGAHVLTIILNWHRAVDGRGISEEMRSSYLNAFKNWILDVWMPWHKECDNCAMIDVNRCVT